MTKILGLDPGKTTGWALAEATFNDYKWVKTGEVQSTTFYDWLVKAIPLVEIVVCEDFVINPKVHSWQNTRNTNNNLPIAKMVGAVMFACHFFGRRLVIQEAKIKLTGYPLAGLKWEKDSNKKMRHQWDAMAHIAYFMRNEFGV